MIVKPDTPPSESPLVRFEDLLAEYEQGSMLDSLAEHVTACFHEAEEHRRTSGAEDDILYAMRAWASKYTPEEMARLGITEGEDIFLPITNLKCRALRSWLHDILANSEEKPWTLAPTPEPELSPEAEDAVIDILMQELEANGLADVDLRSRAVYYKDIARRHEMRLAERATKRMEDRLHDVMVQGEWRATFSAFLADLSVYPSAFVKGPVLRRTKTLRWRGSRLATVEQLQYTSSRVHPLDIFPSPQSTSLQDGPYLIERMRFTQSQLMDLLKIPGFNEEAVRSLLVAAPEGVDLDLPTDAEREEEEKRESTAVQTPGQRYDIIQYWGEIEGRLLIEQGLDLPDPQAIYNAEVWVCNGQVLRAILNPYPLGKRPYYGSSFEPIPGQVWGRSLPEILRDTQRVANASARSLVRNMAFSSGPIGEYDADRMANEQNIEEIEPYRMYATRTDAFNQTNRAAINFMEVPSVAKDLMAVMDRFEKIADNISGIPAYVLGNPQVAGAGRTLGGLSLLMGNAAKGIKLVISNIDTDVIEPLVRAFHFLLMMLDSDITIKADAKVIARGSSGLLQRELMQARSVEVLNMLTPYASANLVPAEGLQVVLRDLLASLGYRVDEIVPDPERQKQLARFSQQLQAQPNALGARRVPPMRSSSGPATPPPVLDRRSLPPPDPSTASRVPSDRSV